jgi:RHS repeat-associated protein
MKLVNFVFIFLLIGCFAEAKKTPKLNVKIQPKLSHTKEAKPRHITKIQKKIILNADIKAFPPLWDIDFGTIEPGSIVDLTYNFNQLTIGYSIWFGPFIVTGDSFTILDDGCANVTLEYGDECFFTVRFNPTAAGPYTGTMDVPWADVLIPPPSPPRSGSMRWNLLGDSRDPLANPAALDKGKLACGSIINVDSRTVGEVVPIVGTNFSLVYSTEFAADHLSPNNTISRANSFNPEGMSISILHYFDILQGRVMNGSGASQNTPYVFKSGNIWTVSRSGDEIYVFDYYGSHIETKTAITGATKYAFTYNVDHKLIKIEDAFGNETLFNRTSGNLSSIVAPRGQVTVITTNGYGLISEVKNPNNESYLLAYKSGTDLLWKFTKPGGQVTTLSYDAGGKLTKDLGNGGNFWDLVQTLNYEDRQVSQTSKLGIETNIFNYKYEDGGNARWETAASGKRTEYIEYEPGNYIEYDDTTGDTYQEATQADPRFSGFYYPLGYQYKYINGNAREVEYSKTVSGFVDSFNFTSMTDSSTVNGRTATRVFDSATKTFTNTSPEGAVFYQTLNSHEQPTSTKVGVDTAWTYSYDIYGRLSGIAQGSKNGLTNTYNSAGYLSTTTNSRSEQTSYAYDLAGRVTQVTLPDSRLVGYSYDANGNLVGVTPPSRPEHIFGFNAFELMGTYEPPTLTGLSVKNTTYTYSDDKQLTSVIRPDTQTAGYTYNATTGLLSSLNLARGNNTYQYQYRSEKVSRVDSADGISTEFTYYGDNVLSESQLRSSDDFLYATMDYGFDTDHRRISRTLQGNSSTPSSTITTTLNDDDMPTQIGAMTLSYSYPSGRLSATSLDKISDSRNYDSYGNLNSYTAIYTPTSGPVQTLYSYSLTRDVMSRISSKSETVLGVTNVYDYSFDTAGRLITVLKNSLPYSSYTYDSNGNRTSGTHAGTAFTATFDDQDRMHTYNTRVYSYNANGDNTQIEWNTTETSHFSYDAIGNLINSTMPDATELTFAYSGNNEQVRVAVDGVTSTRRIYENKLKIAGEFTDSGIVTKEFVFGTNVNSPDYMINGGIIYRFLKDHLGSPRLVVKVSDGTVSQKIDYTEFGKITGDTSPGFQPYTFAGGIHESHTKLIKFGARYYDPECGRWTSKDPIRFSGGLNLFGYANQDPINFMDAEGLSAGTQRLTPGDVMSGGGGGAMGNVTAEQVWNLLMATLMNIFNDRALSPWEIEQLEKAGHDVHELKEDLGGGKSDLFKRPNGEICVKPKDGKGPGEDLGINLDEIIGKK